MLIEIKTYIDEEFGMVGLALRVECATTGNEMWLWSPPLTEFRLFPAVTSYQVESVAVPMPKWELMRTLCRLQDAGVITVQERLRIQCLLMGEADKVQQYWDRQRKPVPMLSEIDFSKTDDDEKEDRPW